MRRDRARPPAGRGSPCAAAHGVVAEYFGWDPSLVRIAYVILSIFPGSILGGAEPGHQAGQGAPCAQRAVQSSCTS
ncbi:MAG TPA: PspC domain-containing protein [Candidatus Thermoplasmatota archaeon]|nr:PspC domain-containing protein [Candidatus Thermoplasmatota archaeon]